jgi:hypothetical protein
VSTFRVKVGATNYAFQLLEAFPVASRPRTGELRRQTGVLVPDEIIDYPWTITTLAGISIARVIQEIPASNRSAMEMENIDVWPGLWCIGPKHQAPTDISGAHTITGWKNALDKIFYFSEVTATEPAAFATNGGSFTDATMKSDFDAAVPSSPGFPVAGMIEFEDTIYAYRTSTVAGSSNHFGVMTSPDGIAWTTSEVTQANLPGSTFYFPVRVPGGTTAYGLTWTASADTITIRTCTLTGAVGDVWSNAPNGDAAIYSDEAPRNAIMWKDSTGASALYIFTKDGIWQYDGTNAPTLEIDWQGFDDTNNGQAVAIWNTETEYLAVSRGRRVLLFQWVNEGAGTVLKRVDAAPAHDLQGFPTYRQGRVLEMAASEKFLWVWIGGEDSSHEGGIYKIRSDGSMIGPIVSFGTKQRIVTAMGFSNEADGVPRIFAALGNDATPSDTTPYMFEDIDFDPRTVSSYLHHSAGILVLPKYDFFLPGEHGIWRKVSVEGTNINSTDKVGAVYAVQDVVPIDADSGSWGTTLGGIVANAGEVTFAVAAGATAGSGQSARAQQVRFDLASGGDESPYIEAIHIHGVKHLDEKQTFRCVLDLTGGGSAQGMATKLRQLNAILAASTDLDVQMSNRAATLMELTGPKLEYTDNPMQHGTVAPHLGVNAAILTLSEV